MMEHFKRDKVSSFTVIRLYAWNKLSDLLFALIECSKNDLVRPKKYVGATSSLTTQLRTNILDSISSYPGTVSAIEYGLCVPGKSVVGSNINTQHKTKDYDHICYTDKLQQILSCDVSFSCKWIDQIILSALYH